MLNDSFLCVLGNVSMDENTDSGQAYSAAGFEQVGFKNFDSA